MSFKLKFPKLEPKQKFILFSMTVVLGSSVYFMVKAFNPDEKVVEDGFVKVKENVVGKQTVVGSKATADSEANKLLNDLAKKEREEKLSLDSDGSYIDAPILEKKISDLKEEDNKELENDPIKILDIGKLVDDIAKDASDKKEDKKPKETIVDVTVKEKKVEDKKIELNFNRFSYITSVESTYGNKNYSNTEITNSSPQVASFNEYAAPTVNVQSSVTNVSTGNAKNEETIYEQAANKRDKLLNNYMESRKGVISQDNESVAKEIPNSKNDSVDYPYREVKTVGDMLYAVNNLPINSDSSPVVQFTSVAPGDSHGAIFSGSVKKIDNEVFIQFNSYSKNGETFPVNAIAIDPNDYSTLFADDVDHHYFQRYSGIIIASMIEGYAGSLQDTSVSTSVSGERETTKRVEDFKDRLLIGIGKVGENLSPQFLNDVNRPSTVHVYKDKPVGILFLDNFKIPYSD
jgi:hypothetical protein